MDILNGTPLLDIKPYVPLFDNRLNAKSGWVSNPELGMVKGKAKHRNSFNGEIKSIIDKGPIIKIVTDIGIPFSAIITRQSFNDMELKGGMSAYFTFKASDVHLI